MFENMSLKEKLKYWMGEIIFLLAFLSFLIKKNLKYFRGPFIFSIIFLSILIPVYAFDVEPFLTLLLILVTPVILVTNAFNLQADLLGFMFFYILVFVYCLFLGLIIKGIFTSRRDRFLLIGFLLFNRFGVGRSQKNFMRKQFKANWFSFGAICQR